MMAVLRHPVVLALGIGLVLCSVVAVADDERIGVGRTLAVGIWGGSHEQILKDVTIPLFEERTGAQVSLVLGNSATRFARLYAERGNPTMDVVVLAIGYAEQALNDGVLLPSNPAGVPAFATLLPQAQRVCYGAAIQALGIMYNPAYVDPPTSWHDLWKPEYAGKVAVQNFPGTQGSATLVMMARINGGSEFDIQPGIDALVELDVPFILHGVDAVNTAFLQEEVWMVPQFRGYAQAFKIDKDGPVDWALPKEGAPISMNTAAITAGSRNVDLAEVFLDIYLGQETQAAYAQRLYFTPTNTAVVLDDRTAALAGFDADEQELLRALDWAMITEKTEAWTEIWNRQVIP